MTATTPTRRQLAFDRNHYLDCRQPAWRLYEEQGLIRFERELGAKTARVFVDDDCVEVVVALQARTHRVPVASR